MHNRKLAVLLLLLLHVPLVIYVVGSDWAFARMSDGFWVGTFPLLYLGLAIMLLVIMMVDAQHTEIMDEMTRWSMAGLARIAVITVSGLGFAFYHETLGFFFGGVMVLVLLSYLAGQRSPRHIAGYALALSATVFGLFWLIGFDPPIGSLIADVIG